MIVPESSMFPATETHLQNFCRWVFHGILSGSTPSTCVICVVPIVNGSLSMTRCERLIVSVTIDMFCFLLLRRQMMNTATIACANRMIPKIMLLSDLPVSGNRTLSAAEVGVTVAVGIGVASGAGIASLYSLQTMCCLEMKDRIISCLFRETHRTGTATRQRLRLCCHLPYPASADSCGWSCAKGIIYCSPAHQCPVSCYRRNTFSASLLLATAR